MVAVGMKNRSVVWEHNEEPASLLDVTALCSMQSRLSIRSLNQTFGALGAFACARAVSHTIQM